MKNQSGICNNLSGIRKSAGKLADGTRLKWMYYEEYKKLNKENTKAS